MKCSNGEKDVYYLFVHFDESNDKEKGLKLWNVFLPTSVYGSQSWTRQGKHKSNLNAVEMGYLTVCDKIRRFNG